MCATTISLGHIRHVSREQREGEKGNKKVNVVSYFYGHIHWKSTVRNYSALERIFPDCKQFDEGDNKSIFTSCSINNGLSSALDTARKVKKMKNKR